MVNRLGIPDKNTICIGYLRNLVHLCETINLFLEIFHTARHDIIHSARWSAAPFFSDWAYAYNQQILFSVFCISARHGAAVFSPRRRAKIGILMGDQHLFIDHISPPLPRYYRRKKISADRTWHRIFVTGAARKLDAMSHLRILCIINTAISISGYYRKVPEV